MRRVLRYWPVIVMLLAAALGYALGLQRYVSPDMLARHQAALHRLVSAHPVELALIYVAVFAASLMLSLPGGAVVTALGGLLFGTIPGTALAVAGAVIAAELIFLAMRHAAAERLARRHGALFERIRRRMQTDGVSYLLVLRLLPVLPFWLVSLLPVLVGMRLLPYTLATLAGVIPPTILFASVGTALDHLLATAAHPDLSSLFPWRQLLPLGGLALVCMIPVGWRAWKNRNARKKPRRK